MSAPGSLKQFFTMTFYDGGKTAKGSYKFNAPGKYGFTSFEAHRAGAE